MTRKGLIKYVYGLAELVNEENKDVHKLTAGREAGVQSGD